MNTFGKILDEIWTKVIRFKQNQKTLHSQQHPISNNYGNLHSKKETSGNLSHFFMFLKLNNVFKKHLAKIKLYFRYLWRD